MTALYVRSIAVWTPRYPSYAAFRARAAVEPGSEPGSPAAALLGARARGRASLLTRMVAEVVGVAAVNARLDLRHAAILIGSAFGEMETTAQLLKMMHEGDGALSPARFQSSVHNAAAGLLSIATGNQAFSSCLSAGDATALALLVEARAVLAESGGEVLVAMADERLPAFFGNNAGFEAASAALVLSVEPAGALAALSELERIAESAPGRAAELLGPTPVAPLLDLIAALRSEGP
jgi:hypothetical protein